MTFFSSRVIGRARSAPTGIAEVTIGNSLRDKTNRPSATQARILTKFFRPDARDNGTDALGENPSRRLDELR
jgi:hypothetical protein